MIKTKQDRILNTFDEMFPDARCVLNHSNNLELLVAVMLSAQTTDESVNKLTSHLFQKYKTVDDYANASLPELESDLHSIGLYRNKAKNIKAMAVALQGCFNIFTRSRKKDCQCCYGRRIWLSSYCGRYTC